MNQRKDDYMRGYADGFKDGAKTQIATVVDDLIDALDGLIYDHCYGEARLAAEKVLVSRHTSQAS